MLIGLAILSWSAISLIGVGVDHIFSSKYDAEARDSQALLLTSAAGVALVLWGIGAFQRVPRPAKDDKGTA